MEPTPDLYSRPAPQPQAGATGPALKPLTLWLARDHIKSVVWISGITAVVIAVLHLLLTPVSNFLDIQVMANDGFIISAESSSHTIMIGELNVSWLVYSAPFVISLSIGGFVIGIIGAAVTRTHLGAGLARRSIVAINFMSWALAAAIVAAATLLVSIAAMVISGNFSGTLSTFQLEESSLSVVFTGILWIAPVMAFMGLMISYSLGYAISLAYVRLHWIVPTAALFLIVNVLPGVWERAGLPSLYLTLPDPTANALLQLSQTFVYQAIIGGVCIWLLNRRLPIRR